MEERARFIYHIQSVVLSIFLNLCIFTTANFGLKLPDSTPVSFSDHTNVEITNVFHSSNHRSKRSLPLLPESFNLHFDITGNPIKFSLQRNIHIPTDIPTYLAKNDAIEFYKDKPQINEAFYQDPQYTASVHLECSTQTGKQCQEYQIFASFVRHGIHYILHPDSTDKSNTTKPLAHKYKVTQPSTKYQIKSDYRKMGSNNLRKSLEDSKHRYKRQVTGNYEVELFIVTDYSVFKYWYDSSTKTTDTQKTLDARRNVYIYFAFLLNGLDARYQNLPGATYTLKVIYAGLQITESPLLSRWTEDRKGAEATPKVPANGVLDAFSDWINANKVSLPAHDHAMLFTRYDFHRDQNTLDNSITGLATLSGMCTTESQSIVEENFNFLSQTVAAHELGHSLSAVHDGDQNSCSGGYIMSATSSAQTGITAHRPWEFSSCTQSEIRNFISGLISNCMLARSSQEDPNALNPYLTPPIGQYYTLDEQCQRLAGAGSYLCVNQYTNNDYASICTGIWCLSSTNPDRCTLYIPGDGTLCGNKKWCVNGVCTASALAPAADDTCVFGDARGIAVNSVTCQQMMVESPYFCYTEGIRQSCCESCKANYNPTNPNCLYGDKTDCASITSANSHNCYNNAELCCSTCQQYETGIPGCKYGDTVSGCVKSNCPAYSQSSLALCCQTCYTGTTTVRTTTTTTPTTTPTTTITTTPSPTVVTPPITTGAVVTTTTSQTTSTATSSTTSVVSTTVTPESRTSTSTSLTITPPTSTSPSLTTTPITTIKPPTTTSPSIPTTSPTTISSSLTTTQTLTPSLMTTPSVTVTTRLPTTTIGSTTVESRPWLLPVIGASAGVVFLIVIIIVVCCMCRSSGGDKKPRYTGSVRSNRGDGFTNPNMVFTVPEVDNYHVARAPPPNYPPPSPPYKASLYNNVSAHQPVMLDGRRPKVALKPPPNKRPPAAVRQVSIDRGTSVKSAPPGEKHTLSNNQLYYENVEVKTHLNHGYEH